MKGFFRVAILFAAFSVAASSQAAEPAQRWALLVGIDDYAELEDLKFAGADIRAVKGELLARGFDEKNVFVLDDRAGQTKYRPSKSNFDRQLDLLMQIAEGDDLLLVAFSGHGVHIDGKSYLCPADARLDEPETLIGLDSVYERLRKSPAALKLMVVDCCRNDPRLAGRRAAGGVDVTSQFAHDLLRAPEGIVLLNSCAPGQMSMEDQAVGHGVFMHFLIEGLHGGADADRNGHVSLGELSQFAGLETKRYVARQFNGVQTPKLLGDLSTDALAFDIGEYRRPPANLATPSFLSPAPLMTATPRKPNRQKIKAIKAHHKTINLRVGNQNVGTMDDLLCTIDRYQGDWVWIHVNGGQEGWVHKNDVVPIDSAIDHFTRQIQAQPKKPEWYYRRSLVWESKGDLDMALGDINDAIRLQPTEVVYYSQRADIHSAKQEYEGALADCNEALRHNPNKAAIWQRAASIRYNMKDYDTAIKNATRAIELEPRSPFAYKNRADALDKKGETKRALADLEKASRLDPTDLYACRRRAWILATCSDRNLRDGKKALELAKRACELTDWKDYDCLDGLGAAHAQIGDFENAIKYGTQAFELATSASREFIGKRLEFYKAGKW